MDSNLGSEAKLNAYDILLIHIHIRGYVVKSNGKKW